jgi:hypothetical protein
VEDAHEGVLIGSYPVWRGNKVGANFVVSSTEATEVDKAIAAIDAGLRTKNIEPLDEEI